MTIENDIRIELKKWTILRYFEFGITYMDEFRYVRKYDYDLFYETLDNILDEMGWTDHLIEMANDEADRLSLSRTYM